MMKQNSIKYNEIMRSKKRIMHLTSFLPCPKNAWEEEAQKTYRTNLVISDLYERKVIGLNKERHLRATLAPIEYKVILTSPEIIDDEEKKKRIKISLLNDWLNLSGLGNHIRCFNC